MQDDGLGIDWLLDAGGDLVIGGNGDLQWVNSTQNLQQGMQILLLTQPGDYVFDPNYGFPSGQYAQRNMTPQQQVQLMGDVNRALLYDPRIAQVANVSVTPGDTTTVQVQVVSITGMPANGQVSIG